MTVRILMICLIIVACNGNKDNSANADTKQEKDMIAEQDIERFSDAVIYGELDTVKKMVADNPQIVNSQDKYGFSALHNVMCEEQTNTISYIIENGANVNIQNDEGIGPLHLACFVENAELLLNSGANINLKDNQGNTPLHILASDGEEREDVIEYLISKGATKNIENIHGQIPLEVATSREDKAIMELLK